MWRDMGVGLLWLGVTAMLFAAAWRIARRLFPRDGPMTRTMHAIVIAWAALAGLGFMLGVLGALSGAALLVGAALCAAGLAVGAGSIAKVAQEALHESGECASWWEVAWLGLLAFAMTRVALDGLGAFPTDWDTLTYHLPLVVQWLHAGSLYAPADAFWYCPGNNELWTLWLVAPFSGDFPHALTNVPASVLLACSAVELARRLGAKEMMSNLAGLVVVGVWPVFRQLTTTENDLAVAALFLASLAYGVRAAQGGGHGNTLLAGVAIGLLAGTKYYALGYAMVAGSVLVGQAMLRDGTASAARTTLVVVAGVMLFGGYWYLRNWLMGGSPTYPKGLTAGGDLWARMRPYSWESTLVGSGRPVVWPLALHAVGTMMGPCTLASIAAAPLSAAWLLVSGYRLLAQAETAGPGAARAVIALAIPAAFLILIVTPNFVEVQPGTMDMLLRQYLPSRFSLSFASLCVVALGVAVSDLLVALERRPVAPARWRIAGAGVALTLVGLVVGASAVQFWQVWTRSGPDDVLDRTLITLNVILLGALIWAICDAWPRARTLLRVMTVASLVAVFTLGVAELRTRWHQGFAGHFSRYYARPLLELVEANRPGVTCVCDYRYYPFFGPDRGASVHRPLWLPNAEALWRELETHRSDLIVVLEVDSYNQARYANVRAWLEDQSRFAPRWSDGRHTLFERRPNPAVGQARRHP